MDRRDFIVSSSTALASLSIVSNIQKPALGFEFDITNDVPDSVSSLDTITIAFDKFSITPYYLDESGRMDIDINFYLENYDASSTTQITGLDLQNGVDYLLDDQIIPLHISGVEYQSGDINITGIVDIKFDHPSFTEKYTRKFKINRSDLDIPSSIQNNLETWYPMVYEDTGVTTDVLSNNSINLNDYEFNSDKSYVNENSLYTTTQAQDVWQQNETVSATSDQLSFIATVYFPSVGSWNQLLHFNDSDSEGLSLRFRDTAGDLTIAHNGPSSHNSWDTINIESQKWYFIGVTFEATSSESTHNMHIWDKNGKVGSSYDNLENSSYSPTNLQNMSMYGTTYEAYFDSIGYIDGTLLSESEFKNMYDSITN